MKGVTSQRPSAFIRGSSSFYCYRYSSVMSTSTITKFSLHLLLLIYYSNIFTIVISSNVCYYTYISLASSTITYY